MFVFEAIPDALDSESYKKEVRKCIDNLCGIYSRIVILDGKRSQFNVNSFLMSAITWLSRGITCLFTPVNSRRDITPPSLIRSCWRIRNTRQPEAHLQKFECEWQGIKPWIATTSEAFKDLKVAQRAEFRRKEFNETQAFEDVFKSSTRE